MKNTKYVVVAAAAIGLCALFLPYLSLGEEGSLSLWGLRQIEMGPTVGLLNGPNQAVVVLIGFLVPLACAGLAIARGGMGRGASVAATLFFLLTLACEGVRKGFGDGEMPTGIGGKLLLLAALVGLGASIVALVRPERRRGGNAEGAFAASHPSMR